MQAGVRDNGMGPVAQRLTLREAEMLAARLGHVVQTAVTVDQQAVQDVKKDALRTHTPIAITQYLEAQVSATG